MTITPLELVLAFPACFRLTHLVTSDVITKPLRDRVHRKHGVEGLGYLITCPWCTSPYLATLLVVFMLLTPESWSVPLLAIPALSGVAGFAASFVD